MRPHGHDFTPHDPGNGSLVGISFDIFSRVSSEDWEPPPVRLCTDPSFSRPFLFLPSKHQLFFVLFFILFPFCATQLHDTTHHYLCATTPNSNHNQVKDSALKWHMKWLSHILHTEQWHLKRQMRSVPRCWTTADLFQGQTVTIIKPSFIDNISNWQKNVKQNKKSELIMKCLAPIQGGYAFTNNRS